MEGLRAPGELSFEGNVSDNWRKWRRSLDNYLLASNLVLKPRVSGVEPAENATIGRRQVAVLLNLAGEEANEIFSQFEFETGKSNDKLADVLEKFEAYCNPRRNILYEWYVYWSLTQAEGEPIDTFLKRLKTQATKCEFGDMKERMLLCRIVFGLSEPKLKERLLRDNGMDLNRALDDIRASEMTRKQMSLMADGDKSSVSAVQADVDAIQKKSQPPRGPGARGKGQVVSCDYCGFTHAKGRCPAFGKKCNKCGVANHFEKVCKSKIHVIEASDVKEDQEELFCGAVGSDDPKCKSWIIPMSVTNRDKTTLVPFKIDTGAETNVISKDIAEKINAQIAPSRTILRGYNKTIIGNVGKVELQVKHRQQEKTFKFEVVEDLPPILGLEASEAFKIVQRIDQIETASILDDYPDVFKGIGCLEGHHTISLDPNVRPVVHPARRIPLSRMENLKKTLESMKKQGIVAKVDKPTPWVSSMVCVEKKNGDLRICLDPRDLNKAVQREHHTIPTMEDLAVKFADMKHFSILDMKHGYWHIKLAEESSYLTTFNTPFGRHRFLRLPFGLHSSAEVFEKKVEEVFGELPGVAVYFDDLIVAGRSQDEHDENLRKLLEKAREANVRFNRDKIQLNRSSVQYLGHIISQDGMKPDPGKIEAIEKMPAPTDKTGVQRLMGTLNFLRAYIPNMSALTGPLRELLKEDTIWSWGPEQEEALTMIKRLLSSEPILQFFNNKKETTLQVDASKSGLGAVLLQDGRPVAYASRSLTDTEINYPQIDKELLAVVFGCERFHSYLYGRPVSIQTDHKPLVPIMTKPLHSMSIRLQRLVIRLQRYHIQKMTYVPGKYLYIADTLSRAYLQKVTTEQLDLEDVVMVHMLEVDESSLGILQKAYAMDPVMAQIRKACADGWTWSRRSQAPVAIQPYWNVKSEIHEHEGFLYVGERLIIPQSERRNYLKMLHAGHLGIVKCRERARRSFYWPRLCSDIQVEVAGCPACTRFSNKQQREPLIPHDIPHLPWNKVAMDILDFKSRSYIVVVDCYSHFPELRLMKGKTAQDVIMALKSIFSVHGVPLTIMADNMPFNSAAMHAFARDWGFSIITSSPHYPKSNGLAERYVQTIKHFMKACEHQSEDIYRSLLSYRETPLTGSIYSPAEMLFNRNIRSNLPITTAMLKPIVVQARERMESNQAKQKAYYDRGTRELPELQPGSKAFVRTDEESEWQPGVVVDSHEAPRSYWVDNGQNTVRRNRVHIKPDQTTSGQAEPDENPIPQPSDTDDADQHPQPVAIRTPRVNRGVLPARFRDYVMSKK